jgi:shikimate 5-dehydrogenase
MKDQTFLSGELIKSNLYFFLLNFVSLSHKMPNILILGATGYIGQAVAHALTSSGSHTVYGLARTPSKAKLLSSPSMALSPTPLPTSPSSILHPLT